MAVELFIPESDHISIPHSRIETIVDSAEPYYSSDGRMLFHGPDHRVAVTNTFLRDWVICAERGYITDLEAGIGATAHHDDDYHLPLKDSGYESKEVRSAAIAGEVLPAIEFSPEQIVLSKGAIMATQAGKRCTNLLDIQVVRGDLANTGMSYGIFLRFFMNFSKEQRNLSGVFSPFNEVKDITIDKLSTYFDQDLRYPFEKVCPLTAKGLSNLARLKRDDEATVSAIAGEDFAAS